MRTFLLGLLIRSLIGSAIAAIATMAQSNNQRETINLGTNLSLGMAEDGAIKKLVEAGYSLQKTEPSKGERDMGVTSVWLAFDKSGQDKHLLADITFASGKLDSVKKYLPEGDEVEFGRQLYFAMRDLELEGNSRCTIETESMEAPELSTKTGKLRCGKKTILIELQQIQKQGESVQLNEELNARPF